MTHTASHPGRSGTDRPGDPDLSDDEERERYRELLEEIRTIIPGVQVLFAFLLTVPFSAGFERLDEFGRDLYAIALVSVGLGAAVFMTPAAYHRMNSDGDRATRLRIGIVCTVLGMTMLAAAIVVSVFVVLRYVFDDSTFALLLAAIVAVAFIGLWFGLAALKRSDERVHS